ncbi:MAG TPA: dihydrofolate reductase family protein [Allosphingosinicella sp.]|nr:dihydrofolate reductase family protein [Allosphingosinicella sp.]
MRRIVGAAFVSLDGVMQAPGGPDEDSTGGFELGGWTAPLADNILGETMAPLFAEPFDLLLGRKTYEIFAAHWPYRNDDPVGEVFNRVAKYVVTSSAEPLSWSNSHAIDGIDGVAKLKQQEGPELRIWGSSLLYQGLIHRGLIDRFFLMTHPVILGKGKRLFPEGLPPGALKLVDSKVSTTGVIIATYEPAGPVQLGSYATDEPSEAELARREKMRREG